MAPGARTATIVTLNSVVIKSAKEMVFPHRNADATVLCTQWAKRSEATARGHTSRVERGCGSGDW